MPAARLVAAQEALARQLQKAPDPARWGELAVNNLIFEPTVDGEVLPAAPIERTAAGASTGVDVLVGTNRHEHRFFLVPGGAVDRIPAPVLDAVAAGYRLPAVALDRYRAANPGATPGELMAELMTDWFFRLPALRLAEAHPGSPVYEFAWETPAHGGRLGACHALEVPFVFDALDADGVAALAGDQPPQALASAGHGSAPGCSPMCLDGSASAAGPSRTAAISAVVASDPCVVTPGTLRSGTDDLRGCNLLQPRA